MSHFSLVVMSHFSDTVGYQLMIYIRIQRMDKKLLKKARS